MSNLPPDGFAYLIPWRNNRASGAKHVRLKGSSIGNHSLAGFRDNYVIRRSQRAETISLALWEMNEIAFNRTRWVLVFISLNEFMPDGGMRKINVPERVRSSGKANNP